MTGSNSSSTERRHHLLRSGLVGAIFGGMIGISAIANPGFSLSIHADHNLFQVEVASGSAPPESESAVHAD